MTLVLVLAAGAVIGLSLGALGGGGSILAVPVLVYLLGQSPAQATTGSLVLVGGTSVVGALTAYRMGHVLLARGAAFGAVALGGAAVGARASAHVPDSVLLACFAALMLVIAGVMAARLLSRGNGGASRGAVLDDPIITFRPTFACQCPRALMVLVVATVVGLLTGFLGVGGGFLVVPALLLALALPMEYAAGTSLVVITMTSAVALAVRAGAGVAPDWWLVLGLTVASAAGAVAGGRIASSTNTRRLQAAFTALVLGVGIYTAARAFPALS
ncbi:MAG TPA: sulfite exporter TauE/SafE family protein [Actinomycetes bacterium]